MGLFLLGLAYPQFQLASRALDSSEPEHFYAWLFSLVTQILLFVIAYVRYTAARAISPALGFEGGVAWLVILTASGGLAIWGTWCQLFVEDKAGQDHGKIRSSGWLFPTKDKRREKVERRERRYGDAAVK